MSSAPAPRLFLAFLLLCCASVVGQTPAAPVPDAPSSQPQQASPQLSARPTLSDKDEAERVRISKLAIINGRPYDQPSTHDTVMDYVNDTYGLSGFVRTTLRAVYGQVRAVYLPPAGGNAWGTDFIGFMQRYGSSEGITVINGNVRLGMELLFHEDLRYIPCHGCRVKKKIENALLAEITARHDQNGHRFFTLTPTIADFSGPIIAHATWYPSFDPMAGVVGTRLVFATRIGQHLFQEFVMERRHHDPPFEK